MKKITNIITDTKNFLKTCEIYCNEEAEKTTEIETFKVAIKFLNEKIIEIEQEINNLS